MYVNIERVTNQLISEKKTDYLLKKQSIHNINMYVAETKYRN